MRTQMNNLVTDSSYIIHNGSSVCKRNMQSALKLQRGRGGKKKKKKEEEEEEKKKKKKGTFNLFPS